MPQQKCSLHPWLSWIRFTWQSNFILYRSGVTLCGVTAWIRMHSNDQSGKNPGVIISFTMVKASSSHGSASILFLAHFFDLSLNSFLMWPLRPSRWLALCLLPVVGLFLLVCSQSHSLWTCYAYSFCLQYYTIPSQKPVC